MSQNIEMYRRFTVTECPPIIEVKTVERYEYIVGKIDV